jgi:hypothetical protein
MADQQFKPEPTPRGEGRRAALRSWRMRFIRFCLCLNDFEDGQAQKTCQQARLKVLFGAVVGTGDAPGVHAVFARR